jgi:hypothetical protein
MFIIAHPGWGESLFLKDVWPTAKLGIYCEFYYHAEGADVGFDPEFPLGDEGGDACRLRLKNLNILLHFQLGANARAFAQRHYDLQSVCLPRQLAWVKRLIQW